MFIVVNWGCQGVAWYNLFRECFGFRADKARAKQFWVRGNSSVGASSYHSLALIWGAVSRFSHKICRILLHNPKIFF